MPKKPEEYRPSPWLKEDVEPQSVKIPTAMIGALYRLQQDEKEVEYGGAIDFELVSGKPTIERVLAYTGTFRQVPSDTWVKIFTNPDIELTFHTHPNQSMAVPSEGDIMFFLETKPQVMMIVAGEESMLLVKGDGTPPPEFVWQHLDNTKAEVSTWAVKVYDVTKIKGDQKKMVSDLKRELDIDCYIVPQHEPVEILIRVVEDFAKEGRKLRIFK